MDIVVTQEFFTALATKAVILTPVISGIVQAFKIAGFPARFLPLLAIVVGGAGGWLFVQHGFLGALVGISFGLASVGLFETLKTTVAGK